MEMILESFKNKPSDYIYYQDHSSALIKNYAPRKSHVTFFEAKPTHGKIRIPNSIRNAVAKYASNIVYLRQLISRLVFLSTCKTNFKGKLN